MDQGKSLVLKVFGFLKLHSALLYLLSKRKAQSLCFLPCGVGPILEVRWEVARRAIREIEFFTVRLRGFIYSTAPKPPFERLLISKWKSPVTGLKCFLDFTSSSLLNHQFTNRKFDHHFHSRSTDFPIPPSCLSILRV